MPTIVAAVKQTSVSQVTLGGVGGTNYILPLRVRAVCGLKSYTGGTYLGGNLYLGGTPAADNNDVLKLVVSNPSLTYYFNYAHGGVTNNGNVAFDQTVDIIADGLAVLTLTLDNIDSNQYKGDASDNLITIPGFAAYDGIWAKLDTSGGEPFVTTTVTNNSGSRNWVFSAYAENVYGIKAEK